MGVKKTFKFIIEGGRATAGPPIGPALGPLGLNLMEVVNNINEATKDFAGMRVPVEVEVDVDEKAFQVKVGIPTTTALIAKELKVEKGSSKPGSEKVGDLTMEQLVKIAKIKRPGLLAKTFKAAVKEVLGTCLSMGVTVEGKNPKVVQREIDQGLYDELLKEED
ncbi:MAG: 50S ribosomal protein L11 [Thermoprotei archaeon]|nr:MAG: 50S ribosomal protein L11 [Thermoprotei archaeon]RLF18619.1 MAG: 50S ribosomal protein L11 [Thermoprotei archaeon]